MSPILAYGFILVAVAGSFAAVFVIFGEWAARIRRERALSARLQEIRTGRRVESVVSVFREDKDVALGVVGHLLGHFRLDQRLAAMLAAARMDISASAFLTRYGAVGVALLAGAMLFGHPGVGLGLLCASLIVPVWRVRRAEMAWKAKFEAGFPDALALLSQSLLAGHPATSALSIVAERSSEPIAGEFRRTFEEQRLGMAPQDSLQALAQRVDLPDVHMFVTAFVINREVGGQLGPILLKIAEAVRERFKLRRQVATFTAQGRLTGYMLAALPVVLGGIIHFLNPQHMGILFTDPRGKAILMLGIGLQLTGLAIIRKIITIDV